MRRGRLFIQQSRLALTIINFLIGQPHLPNFTFNVLLRPKTCASHYFPTRNGFEVTKSLSNSHLLSFSHNFVSQTPFGHFKTFTNRQVATTCANIKNSKRWPPPLPLSKQKRNEKKEENKKQPPPVKSARTRYENTKISIVATFLSG